MVENTKQRITTKLNEMIPLTTEKKKFQGLLKVHQVKNLFLTQSIKNLEILLTKILRVVYILRVKKIIFKFLIEYKSAV